MLTKFNLLTPRAIGPSILRYGQLSPMEKPEVDDFNFQSQADRAKRSSLDDLTWTSLKNYGDVSADVAPFVFKHDDGVYVIPAQNYPAFQHKVALLNKRAVKTSSAPVVVEELAKGYTRRRDLDRVVLTMIEGKMLDVHPWVYTAIVAVKVQGESPKFDGWVLAATLENHGNVNVVRNVPGQDEVNDRFRTTGKNCEHCKKIRSRKEVFVMRHEDGRELQVGRSCIADFLGGANPKAVARMAELIWSLQGFEEEGFSGMPKGSQLWHTETVLQIAAYYIRNHRYVSVGEAHAAPEDRPVTPTRSLVLARLNPITKDDRDSLKDEEKKYGLPTEEDLEAGLAAIDWAKAHSVENINNDYIWNLLVYLKEDYIEPKGIGFVASAFGAIKREEEGEAKRAERIAARKAADEVAKTTSNHIGELKTRLRDVSVTVDFLTKWENAWGTTTLIKFNDEQGNVLVWFASDDYDVEKGNEYALTGTVKKHDTRDGVKQTILNRCVLNPRA